MQRQEPKILIFGKFLINRNISLSSYIIVRDSSKYTLKILPQYSYQYLLWDLGFNDLLCLSEANRLRVWISK